MERGSNTQPVSIRYIFLGSEQTADTQPALEPSSLFGRQRTYGFKDAKKLGFRLFGES